MFEYIIAGALAGIGYGLVGYYQNKQEYAEEFDIRYIVPTVAGSAFFGAAAAYLGQDISVIATSAIGVAVTQTLRHAWNAWLIKKGDA